MIFPSHPLAKVFSSYHKDSQITSPPPIFSGRLVKTPPFSRFHYPYTAGQNTPNTWKLAQPIGIYWSSLPPFWGFSAMRARNMVLVLQPLEQVKLPSLFVEVLSPDFRWWPPFLCTSMINTCTSQTVLSTLLSLSFNRVEFEFRLWALVNFCSISVSNNLRMSCQQLKLKNQLCNVI